MNREFRTRTQLGLGCVSLGNHGRAGVRLVQHALDLGVRFFDTADCYGGGQSERVLGRALRWRRDEAFIATKAGYLFRERSALAGTARRTAGSCLRAAGRWSRLPQFGAMGSGSAYREQDFSPLYLRRCLEGSLRRLGTDHVDLFQLHGPHAFSDEVCALMADLRCEGKIGGFGVGLELLDSARDWLASGALSSIQVPFGVLDPDAGRDVIPRASRSGVTVIVRSVFAGGSVARPAGRDLARLRPGQPDVLGHLNELASEAGVDRLQLATWFVASRPDVSTMLVGTSSSRHLAHVARCLQTLPSEPVLRSLDSISSAGARVGTGSRAFV